jgi:predicted DNA-binding protein YlxM (UPF0122 family)
MNQIEKRIGMDGREIDVKALDYQDAYQSAYLATLERPEIVQELAIAKAVSEDVAFKYLVRRTTENKLSKQSVIDKWEQKTTFIDVDDNPDIQLSMDTQYHFCCEQKWLIDSTKNILEVAEFTLFNDFYVEGKTLAEIAADLNVTKKTIHDRLRKLSNKLDKQRFIDFYSADYRNAIGRITGKKTHTEQKYNVNGLTVMEPSKIKTVTVKKRNKDLKRQWKRALEAKRNESDYFSKIVQGRYYFRKPILTYVSGIIEDVLRKHNPKNTEHRYLLDNLIQVTAPSMDEINEANDVWELETEKIKAIKGIKAYRDMGLPGATWRFMADTDTKASADEAKWNRAMDKAKAKASKAVKAVKTILRKKQ